MHDLATACPQTIYVAAAIITNDNGETLLVRKKDTKTFMQAGGKIETNESPETALSRELYEELGFSPTPTDMTYIGQFSAPAANESNHIVKAEIFRVATTPNIELKPAAEIAEILWHKSLPEQEVSIAPLSSMLLDYSVSNSL